MTGFRNHAGESFSGGSIQCGSAKAQRKEKALSYRLLAAIFLAVPVGALKAAKKSDVREAVEAEMADRFKNGEESGCNGWTRRKYSYTYAPMEASVRDELVEFFRPYNRRLYEMLGTNLGWDH